MHEEPLFPLWLTLFFTIWAAAGPLVGILIGHYLTRSWQRTQWIADNQKEEYRRLLTALHRLNLLIADGKPLMGQDVNQAVDEVTEAVNTSLFIYDFLEESKLMGKLITSIKSMPKEGREPYHE